MEEAASINFDSFRRTGILSKKLVFKWRVPVSAFNSPGVKRSDYFTYGPPNNTKFYLVFPGEKSEFLGHPCCISSQFTILLVRMNPCSSNNCQQENNPSQIKVSFALLDVRDRMHYLCEHLLNNDIVHFSFDNNAVNKYHQTFVKSECVTIYCALDMDEVIQEDIACSDDLHLLNLADGTSTFDIIHDFSSLLENGLHSDVTVSVEDKNFLVHRAILSVRSPVFAAMFQHDTFLEKQENQVVIEDVSAEAMSHLLRYLYTGQTGKLTTEIALSLFVASDKYAVPKLKEICSSYLGSNLRSDLMLSVLVVANMHDDKRLKDAAIQGILKNALQVMKSDDWLNFLKEYPKLANSIILQLAMKSQSQ